MHNLDSLHSVVWLCDSWTLLWCTSALHDSFHSTLLEFFSHCLLAPLMSPKDRECDLID